MSYKIICALLVTLSGFTVTVMAKPIGPVYPITEPHAALWLEEKKKVFIESGKSREMEEAFKKQAKYRIENPRGGRDLKRATQYSKKIIPMDVVLPQDMKDSKGRVLLKKGYQDNPLRIFKDTGKALLYIDGTDEEQVHWVLNEAKNWRMPKIVLTKGQPLKLSREHGIWFYFEQTGKHLQRFEINALPAKVYQTNEQVIREIVALEYKEDGDV